MTITDAKLVSWSFLEGIGLGRPSILFLVNGVQLLHKGGLSLLLLGWRIESIDLICLELEHILREAQRFLQLDGTAMKATPLRNG
jgi:hypothetical protein